MDHFTILVSLAPIIGGILTVLAAFLRLTTALLQRRITQPPTQCTAMAGRFQSVRVQGVLIVQLWLNPHVSKPGSAHEQADTEGEPGRISPSRSRPI
jgi:hypothetical protein